MTWVVGLIAAGIVIVVVARLPKRWPWPAPDTDGPGVEVEEKAARPSLASWIVTLRAIPDGLQPGELPKRLREVFPKDLYWGAMLSCPNLDGKCDLSVGHEVHGAQNLAQHLVGKSGPHRLSTQDAKGWIEQSLSKVS